ncbi:hypothetical protein VTK56DRAFT_6806 [Thermocarpiscus australiensis]
MDYIKWLCEALQLFSSYDKNKHPPNYSFAPFFQKSPNAQQLHYGKAPLSGTPDFPTGITEVMPPVDTFDTAEEQLVPLVMGALCDHLIEVENADKLGKLEFEARAIELKHYSGAFLLLVQSPAEDNVYQPQEGDQCRISLKGVERAMPQTVRGVPDGPTRYDIAKRIVKISRMAAAMILMAMYGDKDTKHQVKCLYAVPHNSAVSDSARDLNEMLAEMGEKGKVVRFHGYETEVSSWTSSLNEDSRKDPFDLEEAERACVGIETQFLIQHQLAQLAISTNDARARSKKSRLPHLGLHQAAYKFFQEKPDEFSDLRKATDGLGKDAALDGDTTQGKAEIKKLVAELYEKFLGQFSGVVFATPYAGCLSKFVRHFKADICFVDEAARVGDLDLLQIIRKHSPAFLVAVGDLYQLGPFVHNSHGGTVTNPWSEYLKRSSLERAVSVGGIVDAALRLNHRGRASLIHLPSSLIYHDTMMPATGVVRWPDEVKAWHAFLTKRCPTLEPCSQRVLIELRGAQTEKLGSSSISTEHVKYACAVALDAVKDDALKGLGGKDKTILIIAFYKAQAHMYGAELDRMLYDGLLSRDQRRQIIVRTVDGAQGFSADFVIVDFVQTRCPGFTCERHRVCVAMTRAKQAEMIIMNRGVFIGFKGTPQEMPYGHDLRLLAHIYEDVACYGGVVTKNVASQKDSETQTKDVADPEGETPTRRSPIRNPKADAATAWSGDTGRASA